MPPRYLLVSVFRPWRAGLNGRVPPAVAWALPLRSPKEQRGSCARSVMLLLFFFIRLSDLEDHMTTINVTPETAARLRLLASAWDTNEDGAISRLVDRLAQAGPAPAVRENLSKTGSPVHAVYEGLRVEGTYDSQTGSLTVDSPPLEGRTFKSPSGAAIGVVQALNPRVNPNRNGWTFWTVSATGSTLQSLRHT